MARAAGFFTHSLVVGLAATFAFQGGESAYTEPVAPLPLLPEHRGVPRSVPSWTAPASTWTGWQTRVTDLEAVFRSLKSELGLRPIYHHKPIRADGHLFITVIAYQLVQVIRTRLRQAGEHASWTTLRRILEGQQRITATFRRADGRTLHVRKATRAEPPQQAIYDALGIDSAPGGIRKTVV